jgi:transcriptional regulator with XRE-family HTH domain
VDTVRFGRQLRALRIRGRLRQDDLARIAKVSRSLIGRAERGQADRIPPATLERVAAAVGGRLELRLTWNGEALDRLMDSAHAALVELVVRRLNMAGWQTAIEVSFNVRGERGSIDVLAFHAPTGALLVVEVKSVVPDVQSMLMTLDRKARIASGVARERGWQASCVGRLLAVGNTRTSRRRVEAHASTFDAALPNRAIDLRRWLRSPTASRPLAGLLFVSSGHVATARHRVRPPTSPRPA